MKSHVITVLAVILGMLCFALGSIEGGLVLMGLAVWIELSVAIRFNRKIKNRTTERHD